MAITTMDQLVSALASAQFVDTYEVSMANKAAGTFASLWKAGGNPAGGATPSTGSGDVPTSATAGAIPFTNPSGGNTLYLARLAMAGSVVGTVLLYDRCVETSGLSGTVTTAQTVNSTALTRYTSGVGVNAWLEIYTATGSTATTATVSYTNQAGTAGQSGTAAFIASPLAGTMIPISLASGDTGVRSVQSVTLAASTLTAGNFGITLGTRITEVPIMVANAGVVLDYAGLGLPVIQSNACLAYVMLSSTTTTGTILSSLALAQG